MNNKNSTCGHGRENMYSSYWAGATDDACHRCDDNLCAVIGKILIFTILMVIGLVIFGLSL